MAESREMLPNSSKDEASTEIGEADQLSGDQKNQLLADQMEETLSQTIPLSDRCCIYRVPFTIRTATEKEYVPQTVSIGPFHRGKKSCKAAERFKRLYLDSLIRRAPTPETNLKCLIEAIRELEEYSRDCYAEDIKLTSDALVEMMLIDGCFILEMLRYEAGEVWIDVDDPVFTTPLMQFRIKRDIILLENQIPLLILQRLFDLTSVPEHGGCSLIQLCLEALNYLHIIVPMDKGIDPRNTMKGKHLLDLLHNSFIPPGIRKNYGGIKYINCATELHEAGVSFKKNDKASSLFDITFEKGVFKIPPLRVQDNTETLFRNLIAYEQCSGSFCFITSYVYLMDSLISSPKDVQLLPNKEIITHCLGSDEEVSAVINKLYQEIFMENFQFSKLCEDVNAHYGKNWHKWRAIFMREYFSTPWKAFSFFAAILLVLLTTAATVFAILSFFVHDS